MKTSVVLIVLALVVIAIYFGRYIERVDRLQLEGAAQWSVAKRVGRTMWGWLKFW